ncbi:MAG: YajQ family cyclic di-GMP-binding protein [candidate division FCPU426 bacterium]
MADNSFDVVSKFDLQEMDNAVNQAMKEIATRFDFRGSKSDIRLDKTAKEMTLESDTEAKLQSVIDILHGKLIKRGLSLKNLELQKLEAASAGTVRQKAKLVEGIPMDKAKQAVASVKEGRFKAQISIQGDQLRVSGKSKDELQAVMAHLRGLDLGIDIQFTNFR